jgi:hypothetical protein
VRLLKIGDEEVLCIDDDDWIRATRINTRKGHTNHMLDVFITSSVFTTILF